MRVTRESKFHNKKTEVNGRKYASKAEARHCEELRLRERAGEIRDLRFQVRWPLKVNGITIAHYVSDADYMENGQSVTVDVKGHRTPLYRLKAKHFAAQYGRKIVEVDA